MEFKSIKCPDCGAKLKVKPDSKGMVTCEYCRNSFSIETDYSKAFDTTKGVLDAQREAFNETLNSGAFKKFRTFSKIPLFFGLFMFVVILGIAFFGIMSARKDDFNFQFEHYAGTKMGSEVGRAIDEVVKNNQTNKRKVEVCFDKKCTTDVEKLVSYKENLSDFKENEYGFQEYEVTITYDDGYVNKIIIKTK